MRIDHPLEQRWHEVMGQRLDRDQMNMPNLQTREGLQLERHALLVLDDMDDMTSKDFTGRCQPQPRGQALEERRAHLGFEREQLSIQRGGGNMKKTGSLPNRPAASDGVEVAQGARLNRHGSRSVGMLRTAPLDRSIDIRDAPSIGSATKGRS